MKKKKDLQRQINYIGIAIWAIVLQLAVLSYVVIELGKGF